MIEPDLTNERLRSSPAAHSQPDRLQSVRDGLARWAFVCSACCAAIVLAAGWRSDDQTSKAPRSAAWVEKRFADWQPTREERAFEDIDWAPSLSEAESLARKHARAIFLFTYDGADLAGYRC